MYQSFTRDRFKQLREIYPELSSLEISDLLQKVYVDGHFVKSMKNDSTAKDKVIVFIFGNETRGVSELARSISHHKIMIPHFGYAETSYNLSVSCGMILFYLYNINILPGCFNDFGMSKGLQLLSEKMLSNIRKLTREEILKLDLNDVVSDM
jgi:hypothetical protein